MAQISITLPNGDVIVGDLGACRSCKAEIVWTITKNGKKSPLNLDGTSHFGTCPDADRFRKSPRGPQSDPERRGGS